MSSERAGERALRDDELARLAAVLVEGPATVVVVHGLRTRAARAWVTGGLPRFGAAVVELGLSPGDLRASATRRNWSGSWTGSGSGRA